MKKSHYIGIGISIFLIAGSAFYIRAVEAGFRAHLAKDYTGAEAGLKARAANGDGFAAYLLGENRYRQHLPDASKEEAFEWYEKGLELGSLHSAAGYLYASAVSSKPGTEQCVLANKLLREGAGVGDLLVTSRAAEATWSGSCMGKDLISAAYYFEQARLIDPRIGTQADLVRSMLTFLESKELDRRLKSPPARISPADFLAKVRGIVTNIQNAN